MDICEAPAFENAQIDRHPWELARIKVVKDILSPICFGKPNVNILDMGCGDVFVVQKLLESFPSASFQCVDIAFTEEIKELLKTRVNGLPISLYSSLEELKLTGNVKKIDVILLLDVMEHIEDDIAFMQYLADSGMIDQDTRILITVPAYQFLFSNHDIYLKHYRRYNLSLLHENQKKAGFRVDRSGCFFFMLLFPRIIQKFTQRNSNIKNEKGIGRYKSMGFIDKLLIEILYFDYLIGKLFRRFGINLPGLSCFAICQKQQ